MADVALGGNCPYCGTLVACSGSYSDPMLYGECPVDKYTVSVRNHAVVLGVGAAATFVKVGDEPEPPVPVLIPAEEASPVIPPDEEAEPLDEDPIDA